MNHRENPNLTKLWTKWRARLSSASANPNAQRSTVDNLLEALLGRFEFGHSE